MNHSVSRLPPFRPIGAVLMLCLMAFIAIYSALASADVQEQRRSRIGLRIFGATLQADEAIHRKTDDQQLLVLLVYTSNSHLPETYRDEFMRFNAGQIVVGTQSTPLNIEVIQPAELSRFNTRQVAGLFISERLQSDDLQQLITFSEAQRALLFSPFEGDVEKGVAAGLSIEAKVRPKLNAHALKRADIHLKKLFLRIAKYSE
ncbi:MAG: hypothetical protein H7A00_08335 [Hahellaceae bacterium]|nr:hypothetical protein [Hahellaceae bacterium]